MPKPGLASLLAAAVCVGAWVGIDQGITHWTWHTAHALAAFVSGIYFNDWVRSAAMRFHEETD